MVLANYIQVNQCINPFTKAIRITNMSWAEMSALWGQRVKNTLSAKIHKSVRVRAHTLAVLKKFTLS